MSEVKKYPVDEQGRRLCCLQPENRTAAVPVNDRTDLTVATCTVCGAQHYVADAEVGHIGMAGKSTS